MDIQTISVIVGIFIGLGTMIAGCGFAYAQYKTGGDKAKDNLIETLKATAEAEKAERVRLAEEKSQLVISHQQQLTQIQKELSELRGRFDEQAKRANEYKELLQGRDPENQKFIKVVLKQIEENQKAQPAVQQYMIETTKILGEIKNFMEDINKHGKKA